MEEVRKCLGCEKEITKDTAGVWAGHYAICCDCKKGADLLLDAATLQNGGAPNLKISLEEE
jgi:hypothetical protein